MKILLVSSFLPYPLHSGGAVRLYNIIKELSSRHEIILVAEIRPNQIPEDKAVLNKICKRVLTVPRKKQWSIKNILKTGISKNPFLVIGHTNPEMKKMIKTLLDETSYDIIHAETFYILQNIPRTILPIVLAEHNVEYLVYRRYAETASLYLRPLLFADVLKLKNAEKSAWKRVRKLVAVSEKEKEVMGENVTVVPNGVDIEKFKVKNAKFKVDKKEKRVLFIGDFKWVQNRDALRWILTEIWPSIENFKLKLWVVGKNIPEDIKILAKNKAVIFDENAPDDTAKIFEKAFVLLAPIRIGGGTSFKILEAMASGVPVITTPLGAEGITDEEKTILVCKTPEEFANKLEKLSEDEKLYETIAKNARGLVEEKFDWKEIVKKLEKVYEEARKIND